MRHEITPEYLSIDEALDRAAEVDGQPVVIADFADNAGGGAPSDATFLLERMLERGVQRAAFGMLWDPIALQVAMQAGVGARLTLRVGGKMGRSSGSPLDLDVTVTAVVPNAKGQDGRGLRELDLGNLVALRTEGIDIILNDRRQQVLSPDPFTLCGISPADRKILVVKSSQHFYAAYQPIAAEILYVYSPGALSPIMTAIPYERLPTHRLWPWVEDPFGG